MIMLNAILYQRDITVQVKCNNIQRLDKGIKFSNSNSLFPEDNKSYRIKQLHMNIGSFVANEQMQTIYTQYTYKYIRTHTYIHITHHTHHIHMHTI